jgi:hypothetical protein
MLSSHDMESTGFDDYPESIIFCVKNQTQINIKYIKQDRTLENRFNAEGEPLQRGSKTSPFHVITVMPHDTYI